VFVLCILYYTDNFIIARILHSILAEMFAQRLFSGEQRVSAPDNPPLRALSAQVQNSCRCPSRQRV
jgi:hypothetical protein